MSSTSRPRLKAEDTWRLGGDGIDEGSIRSGSSAARAGAHAVDFTLSADGEMVVPRETSMAQLLVAEHDWAPSLPRSSQPDQGLWSRDPRSMAPDLAGRH